MRGVSIDNENRLWLSILKISTAAAAIILATFLNGCGYGFVRSDAPNPLRDKDQVRKIYVAPPRNNGFRPGSEIYVYSALVRKLPAMRRVAIVNTPEEADAILYTIIHGSGAGGGNNPSIYGGSFGATFSVEKREPGTHVATVLYRGTFGGGKEFTGAPPGPTARLINESEVDRAFKEGADAAAENLHEALFGVAF